MGWNVLRCIWRWLRIWGGVGLLLKNCGWFWSWVLKILAFFDRSLEISSSSTFDSRSNLMIDTMSHYSFSKSFQNLYCYLFVSHIIFFYDFMIFFCDSFDYACIILFFFLIDRLSAFYILHYTLTDSDEVASLVKISNLIIIYSYFFLYFSISICSRSIRSAIFCILALDKDILEILTAYFWLFINFFQFFFYRKLRKCIEKYFTSSIFLSKWRSIWIQFWKFYKTIEKLIWIFISLKPNLI